MIFLKARLVATVTHDQRDAAILAVQKRRVFSAERLQLEAA